MTEKKDFFKRLPFASFICTYKMRYLLSSILLSTDSTCIVFTSVTCSCHLNSFVTSPETLEIAYPSLISDRIQ